MTDRMYELRDSNDAKDDSDELRRRIADEGYLFFRRLIEPSALLALRADILGVIGRARSPYCCNNFINVIESDLQTFQNMGAVFGLPELKFGAAANH